MKLITNSLGILMIMILVGGCGQVKTVEDLLAESKVKVEKLVSSHPEDLNLIYDYLTEREGFLLDGKNYKRNEAAYKNTHPQTYKMTKLLHDLDIDKAIHDYDMGLAVVLTDYRDIKSKMLFKFYLVKPGSEAHKYLMSQNCDIGGSTASTCEYKPIGGWETFYYVDSNFEGYTL